MLPRQARIASGFSLRYRTNPEPQALMLHAVQVVQVGGCGSHLRVCGFGEPLMKTREPPYTVVYIIIYIYVCMKCDVMCVYTYTYIYIYAYIHTGVCSCVSVSVCIYIYICIHTYLYMQLLRGNAAANCCCRSTVASFIAVSMLSTGPRGVARVS